MADVCEGRKMIHRSQRLIGFKNNKPDYVTDEWEVKVMAVSEGYAMVRRKGAMPYVAPIKELHEGRVSHA